MSEVTIGIDHGTGSDACVVTIPAEHAHRIEALERAAEAAGCRVVVMVADELPTAVSSLTRAVKRLDGAVAIERLLQTAALLSDPTTDYGLRVPRLPGRLVDNRPSPDSEEGKRRIAAAEAKRARRRARNRRRG